MTVAMLWRIPSARRRGRALLAFVGTFLGAVVLHVTWDGSTSTVVHVVVATAGVIVLLWFVHVAHRGTPRRVQPVAAPIAVPGAEGYGVA